MNDTLNKIYELGDCISKMRRIIAELGISADMSIEVDKKSDEPVSEKRRPFVNRKKKHKYTKRQKTEEVEDISDQRSACYGKQIIVVGGDEGTNHYECTSCGDACDIETDESKAAKVLDMAKKMECKACASGRGRHKAYCPKANGEVVVTGKKSFVCDACQHRFTADPESDISCPECGAKDVWPDV